MTRLNLEALAALKKLRDKGFNIGTWTEEGVAAAGLKMTTFVATAKNLTQLDDKSLNEILRKATDDLLWLDASQCNDVLFSGFLDWLNKEEGKAFLHKVDRKRFVEKTAGFELSWADAACLCAFKKQLSELNDKVKDYMSDKNKHLAIQKVNALKGSLQPAGAYVMMSDGDLGKACMALQKEKDPNAASNDAALVASVRIFEKQAIAVNKIESLNSTDKDLLKKWVKQKIDFFLKKNTIILN